MLLFLVSRISTYSIEESNFAETIVANGFELKAERLKHVAS